MGKQRKPTTKNSQASPSATRSRVLQQNPHESGLRSAAPELTGRRDVRFIAH
jgi:hypothetical protein